MTNETHIETVECKDCDANCKMIARTKYPFTVGQTLSSTCYSNGHEVQMVCIEVEKIEGTEMTTKEKIQELIVSACVESIMADLVMNDFLGAEDYYYNHDRMDVLRGLITERVRKGVENANKL